MDDHGLVMDGHGLTTLSSCDQGCYCELVWARLRSAEEYERKVDGMIWKWMVRGVKITRIQIDIATYLYFTDYMTIYYLLLSDNMPQIFLRSFDT
jgi:hypothetical protein